MQPSLWTGFFGSQPVESAFEELAAAGFQYAELALEQTVDPKTNQFSRAWMEHLRCAADKTGLRIIQAHYPAHTLNPDISDKTERLIDFAHPSAPRREYEVQWAEKIFALCPVLGTEVVVVHAGGLQGWMSIAEFENIHRLNVESFRQLSDAAARQGVFVAVENMAWAHGGFGVKKAYGADFEQLFRLVDEVGSPHLGICIDTSHANIMKVDIPAAIRQTGKRLLTTHISDNLGTTDDHLFPYGGKINWTEIMKALRQAGYERMFNLETPGESRAPLDVLRLKARYARNLLATMLA